jgi:hypothetical protein
MSERRRPPGFRHQQSRHVGDERLEMQVANRVSCKVAELKMRPRDRTRDGNLGSMDVLVLQPWKRLTWCDFASHVLYLISVPHRLMRLSGSRAIRYL